jgi:hypothetical protein
MEFFSNLRVKFLFAVLLIALGKTPALWAQSEEQHLSNRLEAGMSFGPYQEKLLSVRGYKTYAIGNSDFYLGFGFKGRLLTDPDPILRPGSRTLRNYPRPDYLTGRNIRIWTIGLCGVLSYKILNRFYLSLYPEITSVSAGNSQVFTYFTDSDPDLYSTRQEAKPSPAGFINPLLRIKGSLQISFDLTYRIYKNWYAGVHYGRMRYEYTSYQLLSYRNDRFMKGVHFWGLCFGLGLPE